MSSLTLITEKIVSNDCLVNLVDEWKTQNKKVVFTNGVFDILHRGHIEYLATASDFGDKFIVGINSDISVKTLSKGENRPIQDENSRILIIAALSFVDGVIIFNDSTPIHLITKIKPDVLIKGGDYDSSITDSLNPKYIVGSDVVKNYGGKVEIIQFVSGYSTTKIEEKIKSS